MKSITSLILFCLAFNSQIFADEKLSDIERQCIEAIRKLPKKLSFVVLGMDDGSTQTVQLNVESKAEPAQAPEKKEKKKASGRTFAPISEEDLEKKIAATLKEEDSEGESEEFKPYFYDMKGKLAQDLAKVSFDFENTEWSMSSGDGMSKLVGFHTLENGLTFLGVWAGGDWQYPVFFIIYWDGKQLRGYIPTDGNTWNTDKNIAYGDYEESDLANAKKRFPKFFAQFSAEEIGKIKSLQEIRGLEFDGELILKDIQGRLTPQ